MLRLVAALNQFIGAKIATLTNTQQFEDCLKSFSQLFKNGKIVLEIDPTPAGSSGFWNSHLIDKMSALIESIVANTAKIESSYDILFNFIIKTVQSTFP